MRILSFLFPVVALCLTGCAGLSAKAKHDRIQAVLVQIGEARKSAPYPNPRTVKEGQANTEKMFAALKRIDVSRCPDDYRRAWFDFLVASEHEIFEAHKPNSKGVSILAKVVTEFAELNENPLMGAAPLLSVDVSDSKELAQAKEMLREALSKLHRISMNYGFN